MGKTNQTQLLDFRSIYDDAWYTVDRLVLSKQNTVLTAKFFEFDEDEDDDEMFNVKDFKTVNELDQFLNRFRPACIQDGECYDMRRGSDVCAVLEQSENDHKFYNGVIESIERKPSTRKRGEERCSCIYVVGWLEGPNAWCTEQMGIKRICKIQPGSPLFDYSLACFVKRSRQHLDRYSNDNRMQVGKVIDGFVV